MRPLLALTILLIPAPVTRTDRTSRNARMLPATAPPLALTVRTFPWMARMFPLMPPPTPPVARAFTVHTSTSAVMAPLTSPPLARTVRIVPTVLVMAPLMFPPTPPTART